MSRAVSPSAGRKYGLVRVCGAWGVARSSIYARREGAAHVAKPNPPPDVASTKPRRRGPAGACTDAELVARIRHLLANARWTGEGHRKVWARLRFDNVCVARRRVLRVMRENGLRAQVPSARARGSKAHDGTIVPPKHDQLWGCDATSTMLGHGQATIFFVVDHCTAECLGITASLRGTRHEAVEALYRAVRGRFGRVDKRVAPEGLALRHDHGSQFVSRLFQDTVRFLGLRSSPAFVGEPECNGCAERFVRTLKEQLLWLTRFDDIDDLNRALRAFQEDYNHGWLIARHGYASPRAHYDRLRAAPSLAATHVGAPGKNLERAVAAAPASSPVRTHPRPDLPEDSHGRRRQSRGAVGAERSDLALDGRLPTVALPEPSYVLHPRYGAVL